MYCHAFNPIPGAGVNLCTLSAGHAGTRHLDVIHNVSWPMADTHGGGA